MIGMNMNGMTQQQQPAFVQQQPPAFVPQQQQMQQQPAFAPQQQVQQQPPMIPPPLPPVGGAGGVEGGAPHPANGAAAGDQS